MQSVPGEFQAGVRRDMRKLQSWLCSPVVFTDSARRPNLPRVKRMWWRTASSAPTQAAIPLFRSGQTSPTVRCPRTPYQVTIVFRGSRTSAKTAGMPTARWAFVRTALLAVLTRPTLAATTPKPKVGVLGLSSHRSRPQ